MICTTRVDIDLNSKITAFGRVIFNARAGEDIVVSEITGTTVTKNRVYSYSAHPRVIEGGSRAVDLETIRTIIGELSPQKIGAMGTSAK